MIELPDDNFWTFSVPHVVLLMPPATEIWDTAVWSPRDREDIVGRCGGQRVWAQLYQHKGQKDLHGLVLISGVISKYSS